MSLNTAITPDSGARVTPMRRAGLTPHARALRQENYELLKRRWQFAREFAHLHDVAVLNNHFPGQRDLIQLLSEVDEEIVDTMADVDWPLFRVKFRISMESCIHDLASLKIKGALEQATQQEVLMMLLARHDRLRMSELASVIHYDLSRPEKNFLGSLSSTELQLVASDPMNRAHMACSLNYFRFVMSKPYGSSKQRTMYASVTGRMH